MQTLDELCEFLGFRVGALEVARFGGPDFSDLALAGVLIKGLPDRTPTSLSGLIESVRDLPSLTLESRLVSGRDGEEPYQLRVQLGSSPGIVWSTYISYILNGKAYGSDDNFGASAATVAPTQLGPGAWEIVVERSGIGRYGLTVLRQSLGVVTVARVPTAPPSPPPPTSPPPPSTPLVTCQISIDGDNPGSGGVSNFVVSGTGFQPSELVDIFQNDTLAFTKKADSFGSYSAKISILSTRIPTQHVFFARGQTSKRESLKAGVSV